MENSFRIFPLLCRLLPVLLLTMPVAVQAAVPISADTTTTVNVTAPYTFSAADFPFSDADGDLLAAVRIASLETTGDLEYNGVDVSVGTMCADLSLLTFTPSPGAYGAGWASFGFQVQDTNGEQSVAHTMTLDVLRNVNPRLFMNGSLVTGTLNLALPIYEDSDYTFDSDYILSVDDPSIANESDPEYPIIVNLIATKGVLDIPGLSRFVAGDSTGNLTIVSTITQCNQFLNGIRYIPRANAMGAETITIRLNDQGNIGDFGGADIYRYLMFTILPINDAPVLSSTDVGALTTVDEDEYDNPGDAVSNIIVSGSITDPDGMAVPSMAVVKLDNRFGSWEYSLDNGFSWSAISPVTGTIVNITTNALLLDGLAAGASRNYIRFVPVLNFNGTAEIEFRAWDMSDPTQENGDRVDITAYGSGGTTPFSVNQARARVKVQEVNDNPSLCVKGETVTDWIYMPVTVDENLDYEFSTRDSICVTDPDIGSYQLIVNLSVSKGILDFGTSGRFMSGDRTNNVVIVTHLADMNSYLSRFKYISDAGANGLEEIRVVMNDQGHTGEGDGMDVQRSIFIALTNDPPEFTSTPILSINEDELYSYNVVAVDDTVHFDLDLATVVKPSWLTLTDNGDGTGTLHGNAPNSAVGMNHVVITIDDGIADPVEQDFYIEVINVNDPPEVANPIPNQSTPEDAAWAFTFPANTFSDPDPGDDLSYSAVLDGSSALPEWMSFDGGTRHFSGTPGSYDVGVFPIAVTATDLYGEYVTDVFNLTVTNTDDPPFVAIPIPDTLHEENSFFDFTFDEGTFSDPDPGEVLTYTAQMQNGAALPAWLTFDGANRRFYGTPHTADIGKYYIRVIATDTTFLTADDVFLLWVTWVNTPPFVVNTIGDTSATEDVPFTYTFAANTFDDDNIVYGDTLTYTASLEDNAPLPAWLAFSGITRTFSGTPLNEDVGVWQVKVTVHDAYNLTASDVFALTVINVNDPPALANPVPDQTAQEDAYFSYTFPDSTFSDPDVGDSFTYTAKLSDGSPLPGWLHLNGATRTFYGTPQNDDVQDWSVRLTATDTGSVGVDDVFIITVNNTNDAPYVVNPIADHNTLEDAVYSFTFLATTFADSDMVYGDALHYSASLDGGAALPAWLSFNSATRTFSGVPRNEDVGTYAIAVTATDNSGASAQDVFQLEVLNTNDTPIVNNPIPDQLARETLPFTFVFAADAFIDVDPGDYLTYSAHSDGAVTLPGWLSFTPSLRRFSGAPDSTDIGYYTIEVTATDNFSEYVTDSFVIEVRYLNDAPVLVSPIADQQTPQDAAWSFTFGDGTFSDANLWQGDQLTYSAALADRSPLPDWMAFNAATRTFTGTPGNADVGVYALNVTATDRDTATATDEFNLTVLNINDAPYLVTAIPNQLAFEDDPFEYTVPEGTFSDPDLPWGDHLAWSANLEDGNPLPGWVSFDTATRRFTGTPTVSDLGDWFVRVTVTDDSLATASDVFRLRASDQPNTPYFTSVPDTNAVEDVLWSYSIVTADLDPISNRSLGATVLPDWLTLVDNGNGTGLLSGTPLNEHVGSHLVELFVDDGVRLVGTQSFTIVVANSNDAPYVVTPLPDRQVAQDHTLSFTVPANTFADDDLGDSFTYSATLEDDSSLPDWVVFWATGRLFVFNPTAADVGTWHIKVKVTDTGSASAYDVFTLLVTPVVNQAPWFTSTPVTTAMEGQPYTYNVTAEDDSIHFGLALSAPTLPAWLTFDDNGDGTGTLHGTPGNANVGANDVVLAAYDGIDAATQQAFTITVGNLNTAPYVAVPIPDHTTFQDASYAFTFNAGTFADADAGDALHYTAALSSGSALPSWLFFTSGTRTFSGLPHNADVGVYSIRVTAIDIAGASVYDDFLLEVLNMNDAPTLANTIPDQPAVVGLAFDYAFPENTFTDPDLPYGDELYYSAALPGGAALPAWLTFTQAQRRFTGTPGVANVGALSVEVTATDTYSSSVSDTFVIEVFPTNAAPAFTSTPVTAATEDAPYSYIVQTSDDGINMGGIVLAAPVLPGWLTLVDNGDGTGTLSGTPNNDNVGSNAVTLTVSDGIATAVPQSFVIDVANVNSAPYVAQLIADQTAWEETPWSFTFALGTFIDPDTGDELTYSALYDGGTLPGWLMLDGRTFSGTPANEDVGEHSIAVTATDLGGLNVTDTFVLTVENMPDAPYFTSTPVTSATEDALYSYSITTDDVDTGAGLNINAPVLPDWLTLVDNGNGTAMLSGTPLNENVGDNAVELTVDDGVRLTDTQSFTIVVTNTNDAPYVNRPLVDQQKLNSATTIYTFNADSFADVDAGDELTYTATMSDGSALLYWIDFVPATRAFTFLPTPGIEATFSLRVTATDLIGATVYDDFQLMVTSTENTPPYFTSSPVTNATENELYTYAVAAADDAINFGLEFGATVLPDWLNLVDNGNGTAVLSGTPLDANVGDNSVTLTVWDRIDGSTPTPQSFTINVANVNNAPYFTSTPVATAYEDQLYTYGVVVADDGLNEDGIVISALVKPSWLVLMDNGDGTATLTGTPNNSQVGGYNVTLQATDGLSEAVYQSYTLTVNNTEDAPYVAHPLPDVTAYSNHLFNYTLPGGSFADDDLMWGDHLTYAATLEDGSALPAWLSFGVEGAGTFYGVPMDTDAGELLVTVTATDAADQSAADTFVLTVEGNIPPVFTSTPITQVYQGALYNYAITTYDPDDNQNLALFALMLPDWLTLTDNGNGTGTLTGTPGNADVGPHEVQLWADDGVRRRDAVVQTFTITVLNVNDAPYVVTPIPNQNAVAGNVWSYTFPADTFADIDVDDALSYGASGMPAWLSFNSGARTFGGTAVLGTSLITVTATDLAGATATSSFTLVVSSLANNAPFFYTMPITAATEGIAYTYGIEAMDDGVNVGGLVLGATVLPGWLLLDDNGNGTGTLYGTPGNADVGDNPVTLTVTDGIADPVEQSFVIVVSDINTSPYVVNPIPDQAAVVGQPWSYTFPEDTFMDDDPGDMLTYSAYIPDTGEVSLIGLSFDSATRTFSGAPTTALGYHPQIMVTAVDHALQSVSTTFRLHLRDANSAPYFTGMPDLIVTEGDEYLYNIVTVDDTVNFGGLVLSAPTLPSWLDLTDNGDGTGTLYGTPGNEDIGEHSVVLGVSDGIAALVTQSFTVTVVAVSEPPVVLNPIRDRYIYQGQPLDFQFAENTFYDPDADDVLTYTAEMWDHTPLAAWISFDAANRFFGGTPGNDEVGQWIVRVNATDISGNTVYTTFDIYVWNVNDAPYVANPLPDHGTLALMPYSFVIPPNTFADIDEGDTLSYKANLEDGSVLPDWLAFNAVTHTLYGLPDSTDVGAYSIEITVVDSAFAEASDVFVLTVRSSQHEPVVANPIPDQNAYEDAQYDYIFPADTFFDSDEGDHLRYTARQSDGDPLPAWLTFVPTQRRFMGTPTVDDTGSFTVTVIATDDYNTYAEDEFILTVNYTNDLPVFVTTPDTMAVQDRFYSYAPAAEDIDVGDSMVLVGTTLPDWLTLVDNGDGTGLLSGTPGNDYVGDNLVVIAAIDSSAVPVEQSFIIHVANINDAPVVAIPLPDSTIYTAAEWVWNLPEGTFDDPDLPWGDHLANTADLADGNPLPAWLGFEGITFSGTPLHENAGLYEVRVTATDDSLAAVSDVFTLNVALSEEPPYFVSVPDTMATQDVEWVYNIVTMDDNTGDVLTLSIDDISPAWLTLVDNGDGTGTYSGTPTNAEVGDHAITLRVSDGIAPYVEQSFTLHVQNVNDAPYVVTPLTAQTATQDVAFAYTVPANTFDDVDIIYGDDLTISAALADGNPLPVWLSFDGSAFSGTPANSDVGEYALRVTATDMSSATAYSDFTLTVQNVNDEPAIDLPASFSFAEDTQLVEDFAAYITDVDPADVLTLTVNGNVNIGVSITDLVVTFSATANWNGSEQLTFTVNDNAGRAIASDSTLVSVTAVNDTPYVIITIPAQTLYEDTPFSVALPAGVFGDADLVYGDSLALSAALAGGDPLPAWVTFDGSTFSGTPGNEDVGSYVVRLIATDLANATAYEDIEVTVLNVNDEPTIDLPATFSFAEDTQLVEDFATYITDVDPADVLTLSVTGNTNIGVSITDLVVTFSAPANWNGSEMMTFTVNDNAGRAIASDSTLVSVTAVNDAPYVVAPLTNQTATQDVAFAYTVPANTFDDVDIIYGDALTLSAALADGNPLPAWLSFYGDVFSGTPANSDVGEYALRVTATDMSGATAYSDFTLTVQNVNDEPAIDLPEGFSFAEDTQLVEDFATYISDVDPADVLTLSVTGNANIGVSITDLVVTFSASANWNGSETLLFTVNDNAGRAIASDSTLVSVTAVNDAPYVIITIPAQTLYEDTPFSVALPAGVFGDADIVYGDSLTLSATLASGDPLPAWVSFDGSTFSGTPGNEDVGTYVVRLIATDLAGATAYEDIEVTVLNVNDTPYVQNPIPAQLATQDVAFAYTVPDNTFADDDAIHGDGLTLTATLADGSALPAWLSFVDGGTFSGTPANSDVGVHTLRVTATDTGDATAYCDFTLTVQNANDAPYVLNPIPDQTLYEDVPFSLTVPANTFADDDAGDVLTLSATLASGDPLPAWVTFDGSTFSGTATNDDTGAYVLRLTATDLAGATAYDDIDVTVLNTNDPPVIDLPATFSFAEDAQLVQDFSSYITDVDPADVLTLTVTGNTHINVSITGLVVTFTATANWNGSETLTFTVNDNAGRAVASDNTVVSVTYVNDAPYVANVISPITFDEDTVYTGLDLDNVFADYDLVYGDALTYTYSGNTHIGVSIVSGAVTLTPEADWFGAETITFTATDNAGANVSTTASVTVTNVNDAPTIALPETIEFDEDTQHTVDFSAYVSDLEQTPAQMTLTAAGNTHISVSITGMSVTFGAEANWNGSEVITFTIDDNQGGRASLTTRSERQNESLAGSRLTASDETTVSVLFVNDAPYVATPLADFEMSENTTNDSIDLNDVFADYDLLYGDHLTYTYSGNTHIGVSIAAGVVSLTPETDWYGAETITFTATDDHDAGVSDDVTVTVINVIDVPQIDAIADTVLYEVNAAYSYQVTGYFFPSAVFTLSTAPEGMTIDGATGLVQWTPTGAQSGVQTVTVKAENTEGYDEVSYQITVINVNEAPTLVGDMFQDETAAMTWLPPANVPWLTGYRLYYSEDYHTGYTLLAEFSNTAGSYTHSAPIVGSKNFYKIAAVLTVGDWTGESEFSDVLIVYPVPHDEFALFYDDGTAEAGYYAPDAGVQFNAPERYVPETVVIKLAVYLWQKADDPLNVTIYRDAETVPGTEASSISYASTELEEGWNMLDVPASLQPVIMGGQFFVSVALDPSSHQLGLDTSSEISGHSYANDDTSWSPVNGNLMIRAVIATGLPRITASETSLDFGDVFAGETATENFTVTNVGNTDLDVTSLTVPTGYEVSLDNSTWSSSLVFTVPWNNEQMVYVRFVPTQRQLYTGNLVIESNDVDDTVIQIALRGNSVEPMPNAFTPNGDGLNDTYVVKFTNGGSEAVRMRIYNTQGREVITIEGTANTPLVWDGRDKDGDECVANPYLMILERGGEIVKRGKVYLVR